ncbi:MAG: hypothetical protein FJX80_17290 [Bacteroidetes bacterium]|nr:hypothetical protein [Bacteroidota bacterium]
MKYPYLFVFLLIATCQVDARAGIGGRIAIYPRTSQSSRMSKLIRSEWNCDPFTKCKSTDFACYLEKCPYNKTKALDCPNQIVGQYSSMCLQIGKNDLKQRIFLGSSFSLVLEADVVARCIKYDVYNFFVSECELFRVNQVDEKMTETVNTKLYPNHHLVYYRITRSLLEREKQQFELMQKQIKFNNVNIEFDLNDYRKVDFDLTEQADVHQFKVSTDSGFSFTLPAWETEKHTLPVYAKLDMGLKLHHDCYWLYEDEKLVRIKKRFLCYLRDLF